MNTILKLQTSGKKQISFQRQLGGGIDVVLVHEGGHVDYKTGEVVVVDAGQPLDEKLASIRKEDAQAVCDFFAQFA